MSLRFSSICRLVLGTVALLAGCGGDPFFSDYAKQKPSGQDVAGTWVLQQAIGSELAKFRVSAGQQLVLNLDGTFSGTRLPPQIVYDETGPAEHSGTGTWQFVKRQEGWLVELDWKEPIGRDSHVLSTIHVRNSVPPHLLHFIVGDPDAGNAFVFERANTGK